MGDKGQFRADPASHVTSYLLLPKHKHHLSGDHKKGKKKTQKTYEFTLFELHRKMWKIWAKWSSQIDLTAVHKQSPQGRGGKRYSAGRNTLAYILFLQDI